MALLGKVILAGKQKTPPAHIPVVDQERWEYVAQNPQNLSYFFGSHYCLYGESNKDIPADYARLPLYCLCPSVFINGKWYQPHKAKKARCPAPNCVLKRYLKTAKIKQSPLYQPFAAENLYPSRLPPELPRIKTVYVPIDIMPSLHETDPPLRFHIEAVGPHPGFIEPCRSYLFEHDIQQSLKLLETERKDEAWRMKGVRFLLDAKNVLQL
jgi:hypothetical protein